MRYDVISIVVESIFHSEIIGTATDWIHIKV